jgi:hypothetical protein
MRSATMADAAGGIEAALRRALLERDQARWTVQHLKGQLKAMRQELRRERAEHRQTALKLAEMHEALAQS